MTNTHTYHITPLGDGYTICDDDGVALVDAIFDTEAEAADMAVRFAQDTNASAYAIYYASGSRLV